MAWLTDENIWHDVKVVIPRELEHEHPLVEALVEWVVPRIDLCSCQKCPGAYALGYSTNYLDDAWFAADQLEAAVERFFNLKVGATITTTED